MTFSPAYRRLIYLTLLGAFIVVAWGGIVRVTGSGLGCADDWPLCQGQLLPTSDLASQIEWIHRVLALGLGFAIAALAVWTLRSYRDRRAALTLALIAAPLFLLQALLGAITVWLELPHEWVTLHFANAQLLLAALTGLAVVVTFDRRPTPALGAAAWWSLGAALATFGLMLSGAYVRGASALASCADWPLCSAANPFPTSGPASIHMLHRYIAAVVGAIVVYAALLAWRRRKEIPGAASMALLTLGLFVLQVVVGALNPLTGFSALPLAAHPAVASAMWCAVVALTAITWRSPASAGATLRDVVTLTKPAIMSLLLITAVGAMFLAQQGVPPLGLIAATVAGGALASGGASSLNHYFDRDIDQLMKRTRKRPLPAHRVSPGLAIGVGITFNLLAFLVLAIFANVLAATLAIIGTLFYIFIYTLWLKRTTVQNIVIGGAAGAIPPLVGWAAVAGSLDLSAWLLFAIVFFWTPAHFWALALLISDDYERAGIPMLPVVRGEQATMWSIFLYAMSLVPLTVLLFLTGAAGMVFLLSAVALGSVFVLYAVKLLRSPEARRRASAKAVYLYSLLYLALLFVSIMVDSTVRL